MKTRILLICLLLSGVYKAMACGKVTIVNVNQPYGTISCRVGSGYELNNEIAWLINIGENKRVRIKYTKDTPPNCEELSFYSAPSADSLIYCVNNPRYFITNASSAGYERGTVISEKASGCCVVLFKVTNGGNGKYPGLEFEFSAAPDENIVETNSSSRITGSQYIMEKLGIGTDAPVASFHLRESRPLDKADKSYLHLSRYQGRSMGTQGDKNYLVDDFLYNDSLKANDSQVSYIKGISDGYRAATPENISSWIKHNYTGRSVSLGSEEKTLLEAKALYDYPASEPPGEVRIGKDIKSRPAGYGNKLVFSGVNENNIPFYLVRYNQSATVGQLRMNLGNAASDNFRFAAGYTKDKVWYPKLTLTSSGKVGIGVENPQYPLHVNGTVYATNIIAANISGGSGEGDSTFYILNGNVGINTKNPTEKLDVNGTVKAKNIQVENALDIVGGGAIANVVNGPSLRIYKQGNLPTQKDSTRCLVTFSGPGNGNMIKNSLWLRRDAGGSGWPTARLHDGVSVDVSYLKPGVDTRTWWERDPKDTIQSWGNANLTYMTLKGGNLGLGTETPAEKLVLYNGTALQTVTQYANASTAIGTGKGFMVGIESAGNGLVWHRNNSFIRFGTNATEHMRILGNGNIGIGTTNPTKKLEVNGDIKAGKVTATGATVQGTIEAEKVIITKNVTGADFVFAPDYKLPELQTVEEHIKEKQHLPEIPSAAEMVEKGVDMAELNIKLLQKVEELTLYIIDQNKRIEKQNQDISTLMEEVNSLKSK